MPNDASQAGGAGDADEAGTASWELAEDAASWSSRSSLSSKIIDVSSVEDLGVVLPEQEVVVRGGMWTSHHDTNYPEESTGRGAESSSSNPSLKGLGHWIRMDLDIAHRTSKTDLIRPSPRGLCLPAGGSSTFLICGTPKFHMVRLV